MPKAFSARSSCASAPARLTRAPSRQRRSRTCSAAARDPPLPSSMARRVNLLAAHVAERYGGDAARVWTDASSPEEAQGEPRGAARVRRDEGQGARHRARQALRRRAGRAARALAPDARRRRLAARRWPSTRPASARTRRPCAQAPDSLRGAMGSRFPPPSLPASLGITLHDRHRADRDRRRRGRRAGRSSTLREPAMCRRKDVGDRWGSIACSMRLRVGPPRGARRGRRR